MNILFSLLGRPRSKWERTRVNVYLDKNLHERLLALPASMTDAVNVALSLGIPFMEANPDLIPTLIDKFQQGVKKQS